MANFPEHFPRPAAPCGRTSGAWLRAALLCCVVLLAGCGSTFVGLPGWGGGSSGGGRDSALGARVAQTARSQIGVRYKTGGTTPRGFDCSGLVWWAYRQHGVNVPRLTEDQAKAGRAVARGSVRAGDILVFQTRRGRSGLHTALYTGRGNFVHSPSSGKRIREDNLSQEYWQRRLIKIRRVTR